ncbi:MAG: hypothetical protein ACR652_07620 [Methylocystis sp.]|uniref:hypothetical protein n=1 Tax=Methylocystis sp. TaxID=1911079 RepID=UPI003DA4497A
MGFFDFIRSNANAAETAEAKIATILDDLEAIEAERARLHAELSGHAAKRKGMLTDSTVSEDAIVKHDVSGDRLHARLERLDALEAELNDRLQQAQREVAERQMRSAFDERHDAATAFHEAMKSAHAALEAVKAAHVEYDAAARRAGHVPAHWHDGGILAVSHEVVEGFGSRLDQARRHEDSRRSALDGGAE